MKRFLLSLTFLLAAGATVAQENSQLAEEVKRCEDRIKRYRSLPKNLSSRALFTCAFVFAEAGVNPEGIEFALDTGARMQDRDKASRGYGNLRWDWEDGAVLDYNAVEFCMQYGALLRLRHWDKLTPKAKETLTEIFEYAIEGCMRHRVPESYTNIALMNAENLILLGEILGREDVLKEGKARLNEICNYTYECGIHEYDSPTYYGVDIECLMIIHEFAEDTEARQQAKVLLDLFWTDLAANWYAPAAKLSGARSRDYNYLRGTGLLDNYVRMAGWLPEDTPRTSLPLVALLTGHRPDARFQTLCETVYPRLVEQRYGSSPLDVRTNYVTKGIALSAAGTNYGSMDLPLSIDFASEDRQAIRGYFIPDARRDPYGKKRIPAGGGHEKTLHLKPFWAATQRRVDALGMVVYRDHDYPPAPASLESHFVFPVALDEIRVGEDIIQLIEGESLLRVLKPNEAVFLRQGQAVAGIRVPWTRGMDGSRSPVALVYDGNSHGAARITVGHHSFWGLGGTEAKSGAAFWLRVGDELGDAAYATWRAAFTASVAEATQDETTVTIRVVGADGPLALSTAAPYAGCMAVEPDPHKYILAINGEDHGRKLLAALPGVRQRREKLSGAKPITVAAKGNTLWEAEAGVNSGGMRVDKDNDAFGGQFVWTPGRPGERGGRKNARLTCKLSITQTGTYYLWGRVLAATQDDDSFFVTIASPTSEPIRRADWHIGTHDEWEWTPLGLNRDPGPTPLQLPKGEYRLDLSCREDGSKIDQILITTDPAYQP